MPTKSVRELIFDKVLLSIAGIIGLVGLVGLIYLLEDFALISRSWIIFVLLSISFIIITTYEGVSYLRGVKKNGWG